MNPRVENFLDRLIYLEGYQTDNIPDIDTRVEQAESLRSRSYQILFGVTCGESVRPFGHLVSELSSTVLGLSDNSNRGEIGKLVLGPYVTFGDKLFAPRGCAIWTPDTNNA